MITIYSNLTGMSLTTAETLGAARDKLTGALCDKRTVFGDGPADVTALDTGPHETIQPTKDQFDRLSVARQYFAVVSAEGLARVIA